MKIIDNTASVLNNTKQRASIFLRLACDAVVDTARPNTPKDKGNLRNDTLKRVNGLKAEVEWRKVYGAYQERGKRIDGTRVVKNYTTPGTGPHFAENAVKEVSKKWGSLARLAHLI